MFTFFIAKVFLEWPFVVWSLIAPRDSGEKDRLVERKLGIKFAKCFFVVVACH